jgi:quinol monooxygenase YgiN
MTENPVKAIDHLLTFVCDLVFTTYERYLDRAAMDRHNNSEAVARFFGIAKPMIDGEVTLVTGTELSVKSND